MRKFWGHDWKEHVGVVIMVALFLVLPLAAWFQAAYTLGARREWVMLFFAIIVPPSGAVIGILTWLGVGP
jgi:hypothetical protein